MTAEHVHLASLPHGVCTLLIQTDDCGMECFDEGDGDEPPGRTEQDAERLGFISVSSWNGGWQYRLTELGEAVRERLLAEIENKKGRAR